MSKEDAVLRLIRAVSAAKEPAIPSLVAADAVHADPDLAQDIEDGAALRRLRSACEAGGWTFSVEPWYAMEHVGFRVCLYSRRGGSYTESTGPTIAAAADACRVALEASRA